MLVGDCVVKSVLLAQLSEEQAMIWHKALSSHQLEVWAAPESQDLLKLLTQKLKANQSLPELIIADIGVRHEGGTSLLATELCKWCTDNAPQVKILLINPRQTQIKEVEKRWAIRRGAIDLLPKVSIHNLSSSLVIAAKSIGIEVKPEVLKASISALKLRQNQPDRGTLQGKNIRQTATEELARKMAMIPLMVMASEPEVKSISNSLPSSQRQIALDATISELKLYRVKIDLDEVGGAAQKLFQDDPLLPGLIIYEKEFFVGMLSRRKFLECLSRPYALELFLKRPLRVLYEQAETQILRLQGNISIVMASQKALSRASGDIYEPVVVHQEDEVYSVLDIHDLLQAQSHIHELATKLLREQTQATMFQTEKMASLGQIVAEVSHDIRNPVSAIYGNTECLLTYIEGVMQILKAYEAEYGTSSPMISKTLEQVDWDFVRSDLPQVVRSIQSGSKYLRRLVDTLQSLSHMEDQASPEPIDLLECVDSSLTILSGRTRNVQIIKNYINLPKINGYTDRLIQVFMNLLSNAIDALMDLRSQPDLIQKRNQALHKEENEDSRRLGQVQTISDIAWQPLVVISAAIAELDNRKWISVKIADNGMGIPHEIQDRIFDNFFTTKGQSKGTGLGLAICHQIITQQHHGKIVLRSPYLNHQGDVTIGTEFEVLLPIS
ncbi:sensor histidine kinase [Pseudanabaena yagii]|uniref:histidine kinase n=1 Tax=Pseudanabaena yagii GIHE-NHR1 TaxID=2722753 RepID=A0ABX1LZS2_9CYAN|nr:HAMP domain-containing sensor histidine kinase [Pseudanabaena yagii]NMF59367.1 HAMP domain-containing histidine kinase [Pseudanabaena yagii GIHE-NHR1]